jgi:hypothetical protein
MSGSEETSKWEHLGLNRWPFYKTVDYSRAPIWAGRQEVKNLIDRFMWQWVRQDGKYIHLVWGDLGAGKSHVLHYMRHHFLDQPHLGVLPIHAVMPKEFNGFLEVYQAIMSALDLDQIAELFSHVYREYGSRKAITKNIFPFIPDAINALVQMRSDVEFKKRLAETWLRGIRLTRSQMDVLEINRSIRDTNDCVAMLSGLINIVAMSKKYNRVLIMLDECQRTWEVKSAFKVGQKINVGLQTWSDANPNHLTLVLTYKCGQEKDCISLISEDIKSRITYPTISLPLLNSEQALNFVRSILGQCSMEPQDLSWGLFGEDMVRAVVHHVAKVDGIMPRHLTTAFNALLTEYDFQIVNQGHSNLTIDQATRIVDDALSEPFAEDE